MRQKFLPPTLWALTVALLFSSCEKDTTDPNNLKKVVVEGYLFAGQPVDHIKLTQIHGFNESYSKKKPISDAEPVIETGGKSYPLTAIDDKPGFYGYNGDDLAIKTNGRYTLRVTYFDQEINATTVVPKVPKNYRISGLDTLVYNPSKSNDSDSITTTVKWDNPKKRFFTYVAQNIEEDPDSVNQDSDSGDDDGLGGTGTNNVSKPTDNDSIAINAFDLTHYGRHDVILFGVAQEYMDLYNAEEQDTRNLSEPPTNVNNGLGIFTAFNSDTLRITLKRD